MSYFLGIDVSTTGAKALIIDEQGNFIASHTTEYPLSTPKPLWSEQDPLDWWNGACASIKAALSKANYRGEADERDRADRADARPGHARQSPITFCAPRSCGTISARARSAKRSRRKSAGSIGCWPLTGNQVLPGFTAPKIVWVRENEPDVYEQTTHILLPKDYVRFCLTGEYATEVSDASGMSLLDVAKRALVEGDVAARWRFLKRGCPSAPNPIKSRAASANRAAKVTGLKVGTPVVGGGGDQAAQAVGSGIVQAGVISVTSGTSGVVFAHSDHYAAEAQGRLHAFCHAVPGKWHYMGVMLSAGGSFRWLRDAIGDVEKAAAQLTGRSIPMIC